MSTPMFRIVKEPRAWRAVEWTGLDEDGFEVKNRIELRFLLLKVDAAAEFIRDVFALGRREDAVDADLPAAYAELVRRIADDWRGIAAENGEPLPFSADNLRVLMNESGMFGHVYGAWQDALAGKGKAREGN